MGVDIERMTNIKTFIPVLFSISPEQKELIRQLSQITHLSQSALIRTAISMLIGGYKDVLNKQS